MVELPTALRQAALLAFAAGTPGTATAPTPSGVLLWNGWSNRTDPAAEAGSGATARTPTVTATASVAILLGRRRPRNDMPTPSFHSSPELDYIPQKHPYFS
jgi:hypothetical protein